MITQNLKNNHYFEGSTPHLNTVVGLIGTGSVEGAVSAGATAYSIPQIDDKLQEQGFSEEVRANVLLGLSAGLGGLTGDTASVANNVNQTQNNYLNHKENEKLAHLKEQKEKLLARKMLPTGVYIYECKSKECQSIDKEIQALEQLSKQRDQEFDTAYANCRAGKDCNQFYYLHVTQRNEWNKDAERLFTENRQNWKEMEDYQNAFHNFNLQGVPEKMPNGNYRYKKFVHNNGLMEIIIDTKDGILSLDDYNRIVRDPTNAGTYNYYSPDNKTGHKIYDVDPYIDFGNGKGDSTNLSNRRNVILRAPLFNTGITFPIGNAGLWTGKLSEKTTHPKFMGGNRITGNAERKYQEAEKFCETNKEKCK